MQSIAEQMMIRDSKLNSQDMNKQITGQGERDRHLRWAMDY